MNCSIFVTFSTFKQILISNILIFIQDIDNVIKSNRTTVLKDVNLRSCY